MKSASIEKRNLINILKKYEGLKLFHKEQLAFKKEFIKELFDPEGYVDYNARTTLFFNAVLDDSKIPYQIYTRFVPNKKEDHIFWIITPTDS